MKKETITQTILTADEGKYLFNGETYGKTVVLPADADASAWREVTEDELPKEELTDETAMDYSGERTGCEIVVKSPYLVDQYGDEVVTFSYKEDGDKSLSKNFKVREFRCKDGSDEILIDMELVRYLQQIRDWAGGSVTINSAYRTPSHNASVGGAKNSFHLYGKAADIVCSKKTPLQLAQKAESLGMKGIEWNAAANYTHIDTRAQKYYFKRVCVEDENGKKKYYNITLETFQGLS